MKYFLLLAVVVLIFSSCKTPTGENATSDASDVRDDAPPTVSLCNWNELGVRDNPGEKGKYLTTIYLGERVKALTDTASEASGAKRNRYRKIELSDGKQGWVREDLIAMDVRPAAFITKSMLFKRPDFATVSDKEFDEMEFVAAKDAGDGWVQVIGKRMGDKWFSTGYVKVEALTFEEADVTFAALYKRMIETADQKVKAALVDQLSNESLFGASPFYASFFGTETGEETEREEGYEEGDYTEEESGIPIEVKGYLIYADGTLSDFDVVDYGGSLWNTIIGEGDAEQASQNTRLVINGSGEFLLRIYKGGTIVKDDVITIDQEMSFDIDDTGCEKVTISLLRSGDVVFQGEIPFECGE
ncbi:MAG TPA: SH3 domain-containing protein [Chryseosolibacter sp.]|nr:SH3 domain-containing protein [Chryseosolibacter sp.]